MGDKTKIEWADASWNPIRAMLATPDGPKLGWHCVHVSEGCRNCYAESMNRRLGTGFDYKPGHLMRPGPHSGDAPRGDVSLFVDPEMLRKPLHWTRPRKIFVCSMTDLFGEFMEDAWIDQLFAIMALAPRHVFQVLTKRPERARAYILGRGHDSSRAELRAAWRRNAIGDAAFEIQGSSGKNGERLYPEAGFPEWPLPNVWLGTSVEDQAAADERIPLLLDTPAAVRWLSMEPLLGGVDLKSISTFRFRGAEILNALTGELEGMFGDFCATRLPALDWVVAGGESGKDARPMHPDWPSEIRDQCAEADVPFHFKQWGEWAPGTIASPSRGYETARLFDGAWTFDRCGRSRGDEHIDDEPDLYRVGKKAAGRRLDGVIHDGYPA